MSLHEQDQRASAKRSGGSSSRGFSDVHHKADHGLMMMAAKQKRNCLQQKNLISKRQSLVRRSSSRLGDDKNSEDRRGPEVDMKEASNIIMVTYLQEGFLVTPFDGSPNVFLSLSLVPKSTLP